VTNIVDSNKQVLSASYLLKLQEILRILIYH